MPRYLSVAEQSSWDTEASATSDHTFLDIASEDISPENNLNVYETAASRYPPGARVGPYRSTGSVDTFVETSACGNLFKFALGKEDVVSSTTVSHVFEPVSGSGELPFFTAYVNADQPVGYRKLLNAGITGFELESTAGELISLSFDVLGREEIDTGKNGPAPTFSEVPFLSYHDGMISAAGTEKTGVVESFSVSFENDIPDDALVLGRRDLPGLRLQGSTVEGSMDVTFEADDWDFYKRFLGSSSAEKPQDFQDDFAIMFQGYLSSADVDALNEDHELNIWIPSARLDATNANIDTRDRIVQSLDFTGVEGSVNIDGTTYENSIVIELVNTTDGEY